MKKIKFFATTLFCLLMLIACDIAVRPGGSSGREIVDLPDEATITFNTQGGISASPITLNRGEKINLPFTEREGHVFIGWFNSNSGGTRIGGIGDSYTVTANITLYAQWENLTDLIVGTWHMTIQGIDEMVAFYSDGTAIVSSANVMVLTYTIDNDGKVELYFLNGLPLPDGFWEFVFNKSSGKIEDHGYGFPLSFEKVEEDGIAGLWYSDDYGYHYAFYPTGRGLFQTSVAQGDQTKITYTTNGNVVEVRENGILFDRFTYNGGDTFTNDSGIVFERQ